MMTAEEKAHATKRNQKIAEIMVEYCPERFKEYPICERMGAVILALHEKIEQQVGVKTM